MSLTNLVDDDASASCRHRFYLHVAGHGEHGTKSLKTIAAGRASTRLYSRADRDKVTGLARCHDIELTPGVAIIRER